MSVKDELINEIELRLGGGMVRDIVGEFKTDIVVKNIWLIQNIFCLYSFSKSENVSYCFTPAEPE